MSDVTSGRLDESNKLNKFDAVRNTENKNRKDMAEIQCVNNLSDTFSLLQLMTHMICHYFYILGH